MVSVRGDVIACSPILFCKIEGDKILVKTDFVIIPARFMVVSVRGDVIACSHRYRFNTGIPRVGFCHTAPMPVAVYRPVTPTACTLMYVLWQPAS